MAPLAPDTRADIVYFLSLGQLVAAMRLLLTHVEFVLGPDGLVCPFCGGEATHHHDCPHPELMHVTIGIEAPEFRPARGVADAAAGLSLEALDQRIATLERFVDDPLVGNPWEVRVTLLALRAARDLRAKQGAA